MKNRSVLSVILFSIITCGIYSLYWLYVNAEDLNEKETGEPKLMNFICAILLGFITCSIYTIYWYFKFYKKLDKYVGSDNCLINLLLTLFFTPIVGIAIAQSSVNNKM